MAGGKRNKFDAENWLNEKIEKMERIGKNAIVVKNLSINGILYNVRIARSQNGFLRLEVRRNGARTPAIQIRIPSDIDAIIEFAKILKEKYDRYMDIVNEIAKRNGVSGVIADIEQEEDEYL